MGTTTAAAGNGTSQLGGGGNGSKGDKGDPGLKGDKGDKGADGAGLADAVPVDWSTAIPLDTKGSGKVTAAFKLTADATLSLAAGDVLNGFYTVAITGDGVHKLNFGPFLTVGAFNNDDGQSNLLVFTRSVAGLVVAIMQPGLVTPAGSKPVWSTNAVPDAQVGVDYDFQLSAVGAAIYAIGTGRLPTGLSMSAAGRITGTPADKVSQTFSVDANNAAGTVRSAAFTIGVLPAAPVFSASTPPVLQVGVPANYQFAASDTAAFSVQAGTLPTGINLSADGLLSGTATAGGNKTVTIRATGPGGFEDVAITLTVNAVTPGFLSWGAGGIIVPANASDEVVYDITGYDEQILVNRFNPGDHHFPDGDNIGKQVIADPAIVNATRHVGGAVAFQASGARDDRALNFNLDNVASNPFVGLFEISDVTKDASVSWTVPANKLAGNKLLIAVGSFAVPMITARLADGSVAPAVIARVDRSPTNPYVTVGRLYELTFNASSAGNSTVTVEVKQPANTAGSDASIWVQTVSFKKAVAP